MSAGQPKRLRGPITGARHNELLDLWVSGLTAPQVAERMGWTVKSVRTVLRESRRRGDPRAVPGQPGYRFVSGRRDASSSPASGSAQPASPPTQ